MKKFAIFIVFLTMFIFGTEALCAPINGNTAGGAQIMSERHGGGMPPVGGPMHGGGHGMMPTGGRGHIHGGIAVAPRIAPPPAIHHHRPRPVAPGYISVGIASPYYYNMDCIDPWGYYNPAYCGGYYYRHPRVIVPHVGFSIGF